MQVESLRKRQAGEDGVNWLTTSVMAVFHLGAVASLFFFTWKALGVALFAMVGLW